jgi:hypothetical protein
MTEKQSNEAEASALLVLTMGTVKGTDHKAFNKWYTETHVPDLLTIPEIKSCRRYRVTSARLYPGHIQEPQYEYSAIYQITARTDADMHAVVKRIEELAAKSISVNESFDYSRTTATFLVPISDVILKDPAYKHSGTH